MGKNHEKISSQKRGNQKIKKGKKKPKNMNKRPKKGNKKGKHSCAFSYIFLEIELYFSLFEKQNYASHGSTSCGFPFSGSTYYFLFTCCAFLFFRKHICIFFPFGKLRLRFWRKHNCVCPFLKNTALLLTEKHCFKKKPQKPRKNQTKTENPQKKENQTK